MSEQQVVPLRSVDEIIGLVHKVWEQTDTVIEAAKSKVESLRIKTGRLLLELRQRVEAGEIGDQAAIDWWGWYGDHFARSRGDAQKLMTMAGAPDPIVVHEAEKASDRDRKANLKDARIETARHGIEAAASASRGIPRQNNQISSGSYPRIVESPPPEEKIDAVKIEAIIRMFVDLTGPEKRRFIERLRQVYRDLARA